MAQAPGDQDPAWLRSLPSIDRATVRRWLGEVGEARLLRILAAIQGRRSVGRPSEALPSEVQQEAIRVYLTPPGVSMGTAAGRTATWWQQGAVGGRDHAQRKLKKFLQDMPYEDLLRDARALRARGTTVRLDLFPELIAEEQAKKRLKRLTALSGRYQVETSDTFSARVSKLYTEKMTAAEHLTTVMASSMAITQEVTIPVCSFIEAYPGLFPDDLPFSEAVLLWREVRTFLEREIASRKKTLETR